MVFMSDDHGQGFWEKPGHGGVNEREIHLTLPTPAYPHHRTDENSGLG